jgi:hypothetical protein
LPDRKLRSLVVASAVLLALGAEVVGAQLAPLPYDAEAVRRAALREQEFVDHPERRRAAADGSDEGARLQFIVQSLRSLTDLGVVPDEVVAVLAATAGSGRMVGDVLLRFGDRAVAPLILQAKGKSSSDYNRSGAILALTALLQASALAPTSRTAIQQLSLELQADRTLTQIEQDAAERLRLAANQAR